MEPILRGLATMRPRGAPAADEQGEAAFTETAELVQQGVASTTAGIEELVAGGLRARGTHVDAGAVVTAIGRGGRFRPWIARMAIPVAVASALLYAPFITDWAYPAKLGYAVATYLLWGSICYTTTNISYGSMVSVISDDPDQRSSLSAFRGLGFVFYSCCAGARERVEDLVQWSYEQAGFSAPGSTKSQVSEGEGVPENEMRT